MNTRNLSAIVLTLAVVGFAGEASAETQKLFIEGDIVRGNTPNGALSASTLGRMWWAPLRVMLIAWSFPTKVVQRGSLNNGDSRSSRGACASASRTAGVSALSRSS